MRFTENPDWFRRAVFYEVLPRSFADGNGDGVGDFEGLTSKLDYLQWLGIDCIWLPPFFPSPWRDGGYDVADYTGVSSDVGTLESFIAFVEAAHERNIGVIIDFVMNHTSDAHPWFEASRTDPDGPYGDFYVWRDDDSEYADARIIFLDTEPSNWSFDPVRGQYFWHRFFHHQPDLNYDNPRVLDEMLAALRFWLQLGVDGFRLDAVPYLIERPGTNGENLPETHAILKKVRAMVDAEFPHAILLCEANQWPHDVVEYFGEGDECHLAFHFPVMPRMYMALKREDRQSLSDILADTPFIPPGCQWGTFLRNHDELTLEMVTPEERDYMWAEYAPEPRMRANLGIRRRLSTLLDDDPAKIRMLNAMLLALPGSPVLYYGDEIGMGDDIWLQDRDGVRTPMQWTSDVERAGFSTADPASFPYPVIRSERHHPGVINVADQQDDPTSLLRWTRDALAMRRQHPVLSLGNFLDVGGSHQSVFCFLRSLGDEAVLCAFNLSGEEAATELSLEWLTGATATHLWTGVPMEGPGPDPYTIVLPPHGFTWIHLSGLTQNRNDVWWEYLQQARWFGGKGRDGELVELQTLPWLTPTRNGVPSQWPAIRPVLATVRYADQTQETYQLLGSYRPVTDKGPQGIGVVELAGYGPARVCDITDDPQAVTSLLESLQRAGSRPGHSWRLEGTIDTRANVEGTPAFFGGEQSNSTAIVGGTLIKILRRVESGPLVEADMLQALDNVDAVPRLYGQLWAHGPQNHTVPLAIICERIPDAVDGWDFALEQAHSRASTSWARGLGQALASVHAELARVFPTSTVRGDDVADAMCARLAAAIEEIPLLQQYQRPLEEIFDGVRGMTIPGQRLHGDFHLGQTLWTPQGWRLIDFEGEPLKSAEERQAPDALWRDVAGMIRSLDYARASSPGAETAASLTWVRHATTAFLDGYHEARGLPPSLEDRAMMEAYVADKAIYEVVYEARNRPAWVQIPLRAIGVLVKDEAYE